MFEQLILCRERSIITSVFFPFDKIQHIEDSSISLNTSSTLVALVAMGLLTACINLARRPDRRKYMQKQFREQGLQACFIVAVDGEAMQKSSGRMRHLGKGRVRLCWSSGNVREQFVVRLGRSWEKGLSRPWAVAGAVLSHIKALETMLPDMEKTGQPLLVLEDDADLCPDLTRQVSRLVKTLPKNWEILQLGSQMAGVAPLTCRRCYKHVAGVDLRRSERNYLAHAYVLSAAGVRQVLPKLRGGSFPDAALVAVQSAAARQQLAKTFFVDPSLVNQADFVSDTCTQPDWRKALKHHVVCRNKSKNSDGKGKIRKGHLKQMRGQCGSRGGRCFAGNGTSAKQMQTKFAKVLRWARDHDRFPARQFAYTKWQLSFKPWGRLRKEWLEEKHGVT